MYRQLRRDQINKTISKIFRIVIIFSSQNVHLYYNNQIIYFEICVNYLINSQLLFFKIKKIYMKKKNKKLKRENKINKESRDIVIIYLKSFFKFYFILLNP